MGGSSERLNEFWEYLSKESPLDQIPGVDISINSPIKAQKP